MPPKQQPSPLSAKEQGGFFPGSGEELTRNLNAIYLKRIKPLEDMYSYDVFRPSWFEETIQNPRPFVTFFGPWSSGKTTCINYLLQDNYLWTGPQPTTASFTVVVHGKEAGPLDGRVLANAKSLPFKGLNAFGESFLQNFQGFQAPHPLLERVTLIDTPGVLEGTRDVHKRSYDYAQVSRWFVERSDLIFFLFDPTKLDAGSELQTMFTETFKGCEGKLRIILNKADTVDTQALMRVYGSLFWNLSHVIRATEPPRVYVGSFWDQPYRDGTFTLLFSEEKMDLLHELIVVIPQQARDKKIAQMIRRAKDVLTHAAIIGGMKSDLPTLFGKGKAKRKALDNLPRTYEVVAAKYKLNCSDFPPVVDYRAFLEKFDVETFTDIEKAERKGLIAGVRECIDVTLPSMLRPVRNYSPSDPNITSEVESLKKRYYDAVRNQYEGREGIQGSSDIVTPASRHAVVERAAWTPAAAPQQQSPQPQGQVSEAQQQAMMTPMRTMCEQMTALQQQQVQRQQRQQEQLSPATAPTVAPQHRVEVLADSLPTVAAHSGAYAANASTSGAPAGYQRQQGDGGGDSSNQQDDSEDTRTEPATIVANIRASMQQDVEQAPTPPPSVIYNFVGVPTPSKR